MKKCPYCAEEIQDDAVKCRYCGEFLTHSALLPSTQLGMVSRSNYKVNPESLDYARDGSRDGEHVEPQTKCVEGLIKKSEQKWYLRTSVLVIAFLCVGPLALPLVWINPRLSRTAKIIITLIIMILSYCLWIMFKKSLKSMEEYYDFLKQLY